MINVSAELNEFVESDFPIFNQTLDYDSSVATRAPSLTAVTTLT